MKLLIANGYVSDPAQQVNTGGRSLLIEDGRIACLLDRGEPVPEHAHVIDATGLIVALTGCSVPNSKTRIIPID